MTRFQPLEPGEPIGVVALSGPVDGERLERGLNRVRRWGHPLLLAPNLDARWGYLAGEDFSGWTAWSGSSTRAPGSCWRPGGDTASAASSVGCRGAGSNGVVLRRGFFRPDRARQPSRCRGGRAQVHGPMVAAGLARPANARRLLNLLPGKLEGETLFRFGAESVVRPGRATGMARGGNLSMLQTLLGTPFELDLTEAVLFVEEVGRARLSSRPDVDPPRGVCYIRWRESIDFRELAWLRAWPEAGRGGGGAWSSTRRRRVSP